MSSMFDSSLTFALDFVKAHPGWYIFPIERYGKKPLIGDNLNLASNDPAQIKKWHAQWRGCNWGLALKKSKVIVADVDVKSGKEGLETIALLEMINGDLPPTMKVTSPSGGVHYYFNGTDRVQYVFVLGAKGKDGKPDKGFGAGVDSPNYVLIPGCYVFEVGKTPGGYDVVTDAPVADAPDWFASYLPQDKRERTKASGIPVAELDSAAEIAWAIDYLTNAAPPSIGGQNGNKTLFDVAALLKDHAISEDRAIDLIAEHYNVFGKCDPLWEIGTGPESDRLDVVVHNAYTYASENAPGSDTSEAAFGGDTVSETYLDAAIAQWEKRDRDARQGLNELPDDEDDDPTEPSGGAPKPTTKQRAEAAADKVEKRPANEDGPRLTLPELRDGWVYIEDTKRFVNRGNLDQVYDVEAFNLAFMYLRGQITSISKRLLDARSGTIRKFTSWDYRPGEDEFIGATYNLYRPGIIKPVAGDTSAWDQHVTWLLGEEEGAHLLDWCAWLLQNVDKKPRHALLLTGYGQGTGKTFIAEVMRRLLGHHNVASVSNKSLDSAFNEWALKTKLVIIEELQALDRGVVKETLHDMITETTVLVNEKNMKRVKIKNCFGFMAMSNEDAAISLKDNDRRYLVLRTHAAPREQSYYTKLYAMLDDEAFLSAVYHQLLSRDLGEYRGDGRAPMTNAKRDMIEAGSTDLERTLIEMDGEGALGAPITCIGDVVEMLPTRLQRTPRILNQIASFFKHRKGGRCLGQFRLADGRRVKLWALGAGATMLDPSTTDVVPIYMKYASGARKSAEDEAAEDFGESPA